MALVGVSFSASIVVGVNAPIDAKYGPFASVATANSEVGSTLRYLGLTVGIITAGSIVEYWYKDGILDSDLILKTPSLIWANITGTPTTLSGYGITDAVPSSRTLTINGTTYDLTADRSWTVSAGTTPTLAQVTTAGNTTTNAISVGGISNTVGLINSNSSTTIGSFRTSYQLAGFDTLGRLVGNDNQLVIGGYQASQWNTITFYTEGAESMRIFDTGNIGIGTTTDNARTLNVSGQLFVAGTATGNTTPIFEVRNQAGSSIMDFRNDYAFFGCGQGAGNATGFLFRMNDANYVQFVGYNYGFGSGAYKPILLDTDLGGRNNGVFVNFGPTSPQLPPASTEFAVRGITSDNTTYIARFRSNANADMVAIRADGNVLVGTGTMSTFKFDVNGTARIQNALTLGNLATDPTGANGRIYYNTTTNKFRGYENGAWVNLI